MQITRNKLQVCHHFNGFDLRHQSRHDILQLLRHHYRFYLQHPKAEKLQMTLFNSIRDTFEQMQSNPSDQMGGVIDFFVFNCYRARTNYHFETINDLNVMMFSLLQA
jgi:hypothetical protein